MNEYILDLILNDPARAERVARNVAEISFSLAAINVVALVCVRILNIFAAMSPAAVPVTSLGQLMPGVPTWFVPESVLSLVAISLVGFGSLLTMRWIEKLRRIHLLR